MLGSLLYIVVGLVFLVWGADRFITGASATARNIGVSPLIIGLIVVGFGTSAPEMVVSAVASLRGNPGLAIGNAVGSNIANIGLVLAISALLSPLMVHSTTLRREYPILIAVTAGTWILLADGTLSRSDGIMLLLGLLAMTSWMTWIGLSRSGPDPMAAEFATEIPKGMHQGRALMWLAVGLVLLPVSSHVLVTGAVGVASGLGVSDTVVGLTIIALGTSLPELAAGVASVLKREHELALGNVIGSNMFNLLGVLGIAGIVRSSDLPDMMLMRDYSTMVGLTVVLFITGYGFRGRPGRISRTDGFFLLAAYLSYQALVFYMEV